jgi:hypothetical protein
MKQLLIILFGVLLSLSSNAQTSYQLGFLPSLNINKKLPKDWSVVFKAESRQSLIKDDFKYDYLLSDLSLAVSKKVGARTSIAFGYLIRIEDESITNRLIQQISIVRRYPSISLAHRFSADQSFERGNSPEFRFRYRISTEIPLSGQTLDPKEFFIKLNNEYLNSFQSKEYDLEVRGAFFVGYAFTPATKLELGIDYRADSFIEGNTQNRFWIGLNFYQSI